MRVFADLAGRALWYRTAAITLTKELAEISVGETLAKSLMIAQNWRSAVGACGQEGLIRLKSPRRKWKPERMLKLQRRALGERVVVAIPLAMEKMRGVKQSSHDFTDWSINHPLLSPFRALITMMISPGPSRVWCLSHSRSSRPLRLFHLSKREARSLTMKLCKE